MLSVQSLNAYAHYIHVLQCDINSNTKTCMLTLQKCFPATICCLYLLKPQGFFQKLAHPGFVNYKKFEVSLSLVFFLQEVQVSLKKKRMI